MKQIIIKVSEFVALALAYIFLLPIIGIIVLLNLFYILLEDVYKNLRKGPNETVNRN